MPTLTVDGASLHYEDRGSGSGPPVALVHAFPVDGRMWAAQLADLSASGHRVIVPDVRGFGRSTDLGDAPLTVERFADDLRAVLAAAGALPCVVGGLSMGGYVALAFARKYAGDLAGLILMDTRADADGPQAREGRQKSIELVREQGPKGVADQMIPKLLAPGAADARPDVAQTVRGMIESNSAKAIERALGALRDRPDSTGLLATIRVPTLVVVGDGDQVTPTDLARVMADGIPGARLAVIGGAGHLSAVERPGQVNDAIRAFLGGVK